MKYDYLIVGSGLYGATFAYLAKQKGKKCLVIDKRPHLGGNVYCADAIGIRWQNSDGTYTIGVYDGGFEKYGESLKKHIDTYYSISDEKPVIDFVICSHSDKDHVSGLKVILENFKVRKLYMNRPWLYAKFLIDNADDGRITEDSLVRRLKKVIRLYVNLKKLQRKTEQKYMKFFKEK